MRSRSLPLLHPLPARCLPSPSGRPLGRPLDRLSGLLAGLLMSLSVAGPVHAEAPACGSPDGASPSGAYRRDDGSVLSVLPGAAQGRWQITDFSSGRSHALYPTAHLQFQSAADLTSEQPVAYRYGFKAGEPGGPETLTIEAVNGATAIARRIALRERDASFASGDIRLAGRLTLPAAGEGPFKAVIFVHGSDPVPSVGREWLPHLLAANGIATLVFDKRGTGCSTGQYVQHFGALSDDVVAAARWLRGQPEIRSDGVGLAGFSQGGWVAPLAALKDPAIRFVAVGYGLAMSMADEDRLEAPLKLREAGLDAASVAEFEDLNAALHQIARENFMDWRAFDERLARYRGRPWFATAARQQSWLGVVMQMGPEKAKAAAPGMFQTFFQPFYDPVPTLERLQQPMLWLMAGKDIEAPPGPTLQVLERLRRQGRPLSVVVFPNADHGIQDFVVRDGRRVRTRYADGYFSTLLSWVQEQQ